MPLQKEGWDQTEEGARVLRVAIKRRAKKKVGAKGGAGPSGVGGGGEKVSNVTT